MFLQNFSSKIKTLEQEKDYTELLQNSLNCSSDTLPLLAEGFRESKRHIKVRSTDLFSLDFLFYFNSSKKCLYVISLIGHLHLD